MIGAQTVKDMLAAGISKFQKPYDIAATRIQLVFYIKEETVMYLTCIDGLPKNTVQLRDVIGKNIYNSMVGAHIKKMITGLADSTGRDRTKVNLFADLDDKHNVRVWLREESVIIREVLDDELTN
jgi:hypothetical protein